MAMTTGFIDEGRRDDGPAPRPASWVVNLLLLCCGANASFLAIGGGGFASVGLLRASFWALVAGLAAIAMIFLWRGARVLRMMQFGNLRAKKLPGDHSATIEPQSTQANATLFWRILSSIADLSLASFIPGGGFSKP
jgi:hypothetical protein